MFTGDRPTAVVCVDGDGTTSTSDDFDFLVDATGRAGLPSSQHFRNRRTHSNLRNVAIRGHWKDAAVLPSTPTGGINTISAPEGWYWVIPLRDGRSSIGFVTGKDDFARRSGASGSVDDLWLEVVSESPAVRELLADAGQLGSARVETDYSSVADRGT